MFWNRGRAVAIAPLEILHWLIPTVYTTEQLIFSLYTEIELIKFPLSCAFPAAYHRTSLQYINATSIAESFLEDSLFYVLSEG